MALKVYNTSEERLFFNFVCNHDFRLVRFFSWFYSSRVCYFCFRKI